MDSKGMILSILLGFSCLFAGSNAIQQSCKTQCGDSCCPHENAVCCDGASACCQQGQTCLSNINTCIGLNPTTHGNVTLHSEKATPVSGLFCSNGTTSCEGGCCPYSDAVCCNDGFCCPRGFECTPDSCVLAGIQNKSLKSGLASKDPAKNIKGLKLTEMGVQICPDKLHLCPGSAECCRKDNGQWGCCPKITNIKTGSDVILLPASLNEKTRGKNMQDLYATNPSSTYVYGECCKQWELITVCCTDLAPKCYWWGCWFA